MAAAPTEVSVLAALLLEEVRTMRLPSTLQCSFPRNIHRDAERFQEESQAWLVAHFSSLPSSRGSFTVDALTRSCFPLFTALTFANAEPARIMPIIKYVAWLFMMDTILDDPLLLGADSSAAEVLSSATSCVFDPASSSPEQLPAQGDPIIRIIIDTARDWWLQISQGMTYRTKARFIDSFKDYLNGSWWQIQYRVSGCLPDLDTFLPIRMDASACLPTFVLMEYANDIDFDDETVAHPLFVALNTMAAKHSCWVNDLISFKKELMEDDLLNLVAILYAVRGRRGDKEVASEAQLLQGVVEEVCGMIKECDEECVQLMTEVKASRLLMSKPGMANYLEGLGNWMRGSLEWHLLSGRYSHSTQ